MSTDDAMVEVHSKLADNVNRSTCWYSGRDAKQEKTRLTIMALLCRKPAVPSTTRGYNSKPKAVRRKEQTKNTEEGEPKYMRRVEADSLATDQRSNAMDGEGVNFEDVKILARDCAEQLCHLQKLQLVRNGEIEEESSKTSSQVRWTTRGQCGRK